jgi:hypothetical protein
MTMTTVVRTAMLGAAAMYWLDPDRGRRRRALVRDKARSLAHRTRVFLDAAGRDLAHRSEVLRARAGDRRHGDRQSDVVLVERVRARLGRIVSHPHALRVSAQDGRVSLTGPILSREHRRLLAGVRRVRGVRAVDDEALALHRRTDGIPALQGSPRHRPTGSLLRSHWPPAMRAAAIAGGGLLALHALGRRGLARPLLSLAGLALVARGALNRPLYNGSIESNDNASALQRHPASARVADDTADDWSRGAQDRVPAPPGR